MASTEQTDNAARRADWRSRGAAWDRTAPAAISGDDRYNPAMIAAAGIGPGDHVLDLASGAGEPAISLGRIVGNDGRVTATDFVAEMLAGARRRMTALGLENIDFAVADMTALPFAGGIFDAVTCRFGIMMVADAASAAREARRALKPGGKAAFLVHGPAEENVLQTVVRAAIEDFFGDSGPGSAQSARFRFAAEGSLATVLSDGGFTDVAEQALIDDVEYAADSAFWRGNVERGLHRRYDAMDAAARADLDRAVAAAFAPYRDGAHYRLRTHKRLGAGTAPR